MTQIRGTLELLIVVPALAAMLISPSIEPASACRSLGKEMPHAIVSASRNATLVETSKEVIEGDKGTMGATGTCTTLGNAEKDLGKDIGRWLAHPKPNDRLGR